MEQDEDEEQVSVAALHVSPRDSQSQDEASGRGLQLLRDELKKLEAAHETLKQTHTNAVTVRDQALEEVKRLQEMLPMPGSAADCDPVSKRSIACSAQVILLLR